MAELVAIYAVFKIFIGELLITFLSNKYNSLNEGITTEYMIKRPAIIKRYNDKLPKFIIIFGSFAIILALLFIGLIIVDKVSNFSDFYLYIGFFSLLFLDIFGSFFVYKKFSGF